MNRNTTAHVHNTSGGLQFLIGRDNAQHWVVVETHGLYGGLFSTKDAAVRYARFECGDSAANDRRGTWDISTEPVEFSLPARR